MNQPNADAWVWQVRVYWEDTDAGGVVYHSQYLNFFERARTEWLRAKGIHQGQLADEAGVVFAIRRMDIDWRSPARLDDLLDVTVHTVRAGNARLEFKQDMFRHEDGVLLANAKVTAACLDARAFKPIKMPDAIRSEINDVE
jgi:acyl-CoA thioester hydrolase